MLFLTAQRDAVWKSRLDERFRALRGCAALTVNLAHYQYIGFLPAVPVLKYSAQLPVMLFFFLSSFLLSHSLTCAPEWSSRKLLAVGNYAINRLFRIFPLLIVVVTLCYWRGLAFFPPSATYVEALQTSLTLGKAPSVLWTIPVELTFYIYLPVFLTILLRLTRSRLGAAALTAVFLAWCVGIAFARRFDAAPAPWMTLGFHHYANSFVGGVLLYALLRNNHVAFPKAGAAIAYAAPAVFVMAAPFFYYAIFNRDFGMSELSDLAAWRSYYDNIFPFAPLVVGGLVYGLLHPSETFLSRIMRTRLLRRSGELSFGVYLLHIPMIDLIGSRYGYGELQFAAAIAATFVLAGLLSRVVETPAIALGRKIGRSLLGSGVCRYPTPRPSPASASALSPSR